MVKGMFRNIFRNIEEHDMICIQSFTLCFEIKKKSVFKIVYIVQFLYNDTYTSKKHIDKLPERNRRKVFKWLSDLFTAIQIVNCRV